MASKDAMNMGGTTSNIISEITSSISGMTRELSIFEQTSSRIKQTFSSVANNVKGFVGSGGGGGGNQVAPNPVFETAPSLVGMSESGNVIAAGPNGTAIAGGFSHAPTNLTDYAMQSGGATLYQSEVGSPSRGSSGGGGGFGVTGGGTGESGSSSPLFASSTTGALGAVGSVINFVSGAYNIGSNLVPSTSDAVEAQLLQTRASYYTGGNINAMQASQQSIANAAMLSGDNPQMDVMRAYVAAQSLGLTGGAGQLQSLMGGAAAASNLMPGLGLEGTIRVTGSMQQARSVNMLRGIGIQLRDPNTGQMKGPAEVIDLLWQKITKDYSQAYGSGKAPSVNEIQISLQPGNALDSMLNQYFGNDPLEKQLVANGLIYRAQSKGATVSTLTPGTAPGTTAALQSYTANAAAGQGLLTKAEAPAATGFNMASTYLQNYYKNVGPAVVDTLSQMKATFDTVISAFGGSPASALLSGVATAASEAIKGLMNFFDPTSPNNPLANLLKGVMSLGSGIAGVTTGLGGINIPGLASGGPVAKDKTYIVGEKGPELFVPSTDGMIVPNNQIKSSTQGANYNNTYNFTVNVPNGNGPEVTAAIKNLIYELDTSKKVSES